MPLSPLKGISGDDDVLSLALQNLQINAIDWKIVRFVSLR
jgi:hypothetical protein